jgi:hypothetical protein
MRPEKQAWSVFWNHKGFLILHAFADAIWIGLALAWFWLPDSKVWSVAVAALAAPLLLLAAWWLIARALLFYRRAHAGEELRLRNAPFLLLRATPVLILRPWVLLVVAILGAYVPYKLIGWHPQLSGLAMQSTSLAVRFGIAFLLVVTSWLTLASLLAARPAKSSS